jgi:hypothetical protein
MFRTVRPKLRSCLHTKIMAERTLHGVEPKPALRNVSCNGRSTTAPQTPAAAGSKPACGEFSTQWTADER